MPLLNAQLRGTTQTPDGRSVGIPEPDALVQRGPIVQIAVGVAQTVAQQLLQRGDTPPAPVSGMALIDTGASATCIDDSVAQQLGLSPVSTANVASASHASVQHYVYPVSFQIAGLSTNVEAPHAIGAPLNAQGLIALIGRDVLRHCLLVYNGSTGRFTLAI